MFIVGNTLVKNYEFVAECDPAIDSDREGFADTYERYLELGDASLLPLKSGEKPTRLLLRHVEGAARARLDRLMAPLQRLPEGQRQDAMLEVFYIAAMLGLAGWSDLPTATGGDARFREQVDQGNGIPHASEESMALLQRLDKDLPYQIGARVWRATYLSPLS